MSQKSDILAALKRGEMLTARDADRRFDCMRLAARIYDLRQDGWGIASDDLRLPSGKIVTSYWLIPHLELF